MNSEREALAKQYVEKARIYAKASKHGRALSHYIQCLNLFPMTAKTLENEFTKALVKWGMQMQDYNLTQQLFDIYEKALIWYPTSARLMNELGMVVYRCGHYKKACGIFYKAHILDTGYALAERNLNHVKNMLVERWHFRMLNDLHRNRCYKNAIEMMVTPNDIVLDVGTGSGLLSLFALETEPSEVIACEASETLFDIATRVFDNHEADIRAIHKSSKDLTVAEIGAQITLLVTEIFDAAIFGEGILETLIHARENLLAPHGRVLPSSVVVYACAIESTYVASRHRLLKRDRPILRLNDLSVYTYEDEPYDTENLRQVDDVKYLTTPEEVLRVDFNDTTDIRAHYSGAKTGSVTLNVTTDGRFDAIAIWFTLNLTEDISICTDPRLYVEIPAWDQALFLVNQHVLLNKDDTVPIQFSCKNGTLQMLSPTFNKNDHGISDLMVRFLNDSVYINEICTAASALTIYLQTLTNVQILDLSPVPVLGFLLMKRGAQHLSCMVDSDSERAFFEAIARHNDIDLAKVNIFQTKDFEYGCCDRKYHVVMNHLFEQCGEMSRIDVELSNRLCDRTMAPGGIELPDKVTMRCKLGYSNWLESANKVKDENVFDFDIADYMNVYQVTKNIFVNENTIDFKPFSAPTVLIDDCYAMKDAVVPITTTSDGMINSVLCYYEIQLLQNAGTVTTNRADSFMDSVAFMPRKSIPVKAGDAVAAMVLTDSGYVNVKLDKD